MGLQIKKINYIKEFGSFYDFVWDSNKMNDFERINLIYGYNGMGKTMLSRFFQGLALSEIPYKDTVSLHFQENFSCETSMGNIKKFKNSITNGHIWVFNSDFIKTELSFDDCNANKITYSEFGKENILLKDRLVVLQHRYQWLIEQKRKVGDKKQQLEQRRDQIVEQYQNDVSSKLSIPKTKFNKNTCKYFLSNEQLSSWKKLTENELQKAYVEYIQQPKANITLTFPIDSYFINSSALERIKTVCQSQITRQTATELKEAILNWLSNGLEFQTGSQHKCIFCDQEISSSYWEKRKAKILEITSKDNTFSEKEEEVKQYIAICEKILLNNFVSHIRKDDFYIQFQNEYEKIQQNLEDLFSDSLENIKNLLPFLKIKEKDLSRPINLESKDFFKKLQNISIEVSKKKTLLENLCKQHNQYTQTIQQKKQGAEFAIKQHYAKSWAPTWKNISQELDRVSLKYTQAESLENKVNNSVRKVEQKRANQIAPIEIIEKYIYLITRKKDYLKIEYNKEKQNYLFKRLQQGKYETAFLLSEGEKTILALSYFFALTKEKLSTDILVIDDPISSLDNVYFFNILDLLINEICAPVKKANQVFILTHNFFFFRKIRKSIKGSNILDRNPDGSIKKINGVDQFKKDKNNKKLEDKQIYLLSRKGDSSKILPPSSFLLKYNSEYGTLVDLFCKFSTTPHESFDYEQAVLMGNVMRRIMEYILSFKYIDKNITDVFRKSLKDTHPEWNYLLALLHTESHGEQTDSSLDFSSFDSVSKLIEDFKSYIKFIDPDHFKEFYESVS